MAITNYLSFEIGQSLLSLARYVLDGNSIYRLLPILT